MNFRIGVMPGYVGRVYLAGLHVSWLGGICLVRSASCGGQRLLLLTVPEGTNQSCHTRLSQHDDFDEFDDDDDDDDGDDDGDEIMMTF